jgi:8-oxo-dGTP diphosphatase
VRAAGGVVSRSGADGNAEYLVVHRPRYDDWSLPKGKLEPDETPEAAARREVAEETGVLVELGRPLPTGRYVDRNGRDKVVYYWEMRAVGSTPWSPNHEVDATRWISASEAATLLTYDMDRRLIAAVAAPGTGDPS